jgi:hypothetical protein
MALPHKPAPTPAVSLVGQVPPLPVLPQEVLDRFPSLVEWQSEFKSWWDNFSEMWTRDRQSITTQFTADESAASSNLASLQKQIDALSARIK